MNRILYLSLLVLAVNNLSAQNGELPPTYFNGTTNNCDNSPWKLVLYDEFNGNSLKAPWLTFGSWKGMAGGDNEDWGQARSSPESFTIYRDANVEVSNGTVKLKVKKEYGEWKCNSCTGDTYKKSYSSAILATPYDLPLNHGKFEARIKMPIFKLAHSTFWTWHGTGVNEIDIAEAYGVGKNGGLFGDFPRTNYSLHSWAPEGQNNNPYNLQHVELRERYPNQTWWLYVRGKHFRQENFHTYGCEWTPSKIDFFVDGSRVKTYWKYYQQRTYNSPFGNSRFPSFTYYVGAECIPDQGYWKTLPGFPWSDTSFSNLRLTTGIDGSHGSHSNGYLGQMEIDYVKIWQKNPTNGWKDVCDPGQLVISGPSEVCAPTTFTVTSTASSYNWNVTPNLIIVSSTPSSVTVKPNPAYAGAYGTIKYTSLAPEGCGRTTAPRIATFDVAVGKPDNFNVVVSRTVDYANQECWYNLTAILNDYQNNPVPIWPFLNTYHWEIEYGPGLTQGITLYGQFIVTPPIPFYPGTISSMKWKLTITNTCGTSEIRQGTMSFADFAVVETNSSGLVTEDLYVTANITSMDDYYAAVDARLQAKILPLDVSEFEVEQNINRILMEELEPYIVLDSFVAVQAEAAQQQMNTAETKVYPNPTNGLLQLELSSKYDYNTLVDYYVYDALGRLVWSGALMPEVSVLDLSSLVGGVYLLEVKQGKLTERHKVQIL